MAILCLQSSLKMWIFFALSEITGAVEYVVLAWMRNMLQLQWLLQIQSLISCGFMSSVTAVNFNVNVTVIITY